MPTKYKKSYKRTKTNKKNTKTFKSPFGTSFKNGVTNGKPCSHVVEGIANRTGKSVTTIINSLKKAGLCHCQKFNGQWVYWPTFNVKKGKATTIKTCQTNMWQCFVDWCVISGKCSCTRLCNNNTSQKNFMNYCKKFFSSQSAGSSTGTSKRKTYKGKKRTTSARSKYGSKSYHKRSKGRKGARKSGSTYAFSGYGTRRYSRAA